ncbi:hypothetical protein CTI12_AA059670 [Artemisia annua]|uniref:Uncharacterized protein n=1 Tax=Artemisia annua TaxID=35608 RepID=A0A2U1Q9B4_ARTAN|nr:hypothetical protein CTI12_AA059670 [Artemisia annua]
MMLDFFKGYSTVALVNIKNTSLQPYEIVVTSGEQSLKLLVINQWRLSNFREMAGRTTEIRKPMDAIKPLDNTIVAASPIEYDTTLGQIETLFNQLHSVPDNRL